MKTPIFILGTGRCGSTILHNLLSKHDAFSWPTFITRRSPSRPHLNAHILRTFDWPLLGGFMRARVHPQESYELWNTVYGGFGRPNRDLTEADFSPYVARKFERVFGAITPPKRQQLLLKITGWPRIGFLKAMFPDAKFVHVYRDGRAVVNSMLQTSFWRGWHGPAQWRWGELSPEHAAELAAADNSFVTLGAIQWKLLMDAFAESRALLPAGQLLEVSYEQLCADKAATLDQILAFCETPSTARFAAEVAAVKVENRNFKWQSDLSALQQAQLNASLANTLPQWGYSASN